jgi:hypothetical protein
VSLLKRLLLTEVVDDVVTLKFSLKIPVITSVTFRVKCLQALAYKTPRLIKVTLLIPPKSSFLLVSLMEEDLSSGRPPSGGRL